MGAEQRSIIPGLPDDISLDCLIRVPYRFHSGLRRVCRRWRDLVTAPSFYHHRQNSGTAESLICLVQALVPEQDDQSDGGDEPEKSPTTQNNNNKGNVTAPPAYGLSLYNATVGAWHRAAGSDVVAVVPFFAHVVAVRSKLVILGGWDPHTLASVADVHVIDMVTGRWRRGAPMSAARSFFACAAVGPTVYVAGGHDDGKNALRSAETYDPDSDSDEWTRIPEMGDERDECHGVSSGGKFWVVSGYATESQGRFDSAAECYDPVTRTWSRVDGVWPEVAAAGDRRRSSCFALLKGQGKLWCLECGGGVREYEERERRWRVVGGVPESLKSSSCVAVVGGGDGGESGEKVFVVGSDGVEKGNKAWVMEAESKKWRAVDTPVSFSGFVYSAASIVL